MRFRFLNVVAALLLVVPGISFALGLGEIQLKSSLNAPLNAEIELFATPEELVDLQAQLASRDTFTRYGLDYPAFLTGVQVRIVRQANGRNIIQLTTTDPVTEPFATFLVEANGSRGRIQHEYTVLFDPPAFAPQQAATPPPPVAAPTAGGNGGNQINRAPVAPSAPRPAPAQVAPPASASAPSQPASVGGSYTVPRGDSLSAIAVSHYEEGSVRQAMIAIFRANPEAFGGNINELRAGAVLRLPDNAEVAAIDRGDANAEVGRQIAEWTSRSTSGTSEDDSPRLVLVPPTGGADQDTADSTSAAEGASSQAGGGVADNRLQVGGTGLASVQESATEPGPAPESEATETPVPDEEVAGEEVSAPAEVQAEAEAALPAAQQTPPEAEESGSSLMGLLARYWYVLAGVVALALLLAVRASRRRRAAESDGFAPFAMQPPLSEERDTSADTFPLRRPAQDHERSIVVEENDAPSAATARKEAPPTIDLEEAPPSTPGIDATGSFEQGDPLAEADFHMAYGLYDQAADLVKLAMAREPERRDLKQKLLEVYFVWGNKEQFLQTARELADSRGEAQQGEWEKVVIMGKQLAPEDPLFNQSQGSVSAGSVDLNLEGGQNLVDFDLPGESSTRVPKLSEESAPDSEVSGLDFVLDEPGEGADGNDGEATQSTQQLPTAEMPKPDLGVEGPTVEQPALGLDDTLAGKLDAQREPVGGTDQTAELALDDLGLDLGKLEATGSNLLDDSQVNRALSSAEDAGETLVAGLDDTNRQLLQESGSSESDATEMMPLSDLEGGETAQVSELDLNLEADSNAITGKRRGPVVDLDVGGDEKSPDDTYTRTQRLDPELISDADATQRDLEPVSMSEVGTKLDLARAYMDMGDPDGARSILGEVLAEGSPTQRQEAQRLLDSIPG
jgi:pilus assembly protein FimV